MENYFAPPLEDNRLGRLYTLLLSLKDDGLLRQPGIVEHEIKISEILL